MVRSLVSSILESAESVAVDVSLDFFLQGDSPWDGPNRDRKKCNTPEGVCKSEEEPVGVVLEEEEDDEDDDDDTVDEEDRRSTNDTRSGCSVYSSKVALLFGCGTDNGVRVQSTS